MFRESTNKTGSRKVASWYFIRIDNQIAVQGEIMQ